MHYGDIRISAFAYYGDEQLMKKRVIFRSKIRNLTHVLTNVHEYMYFLLVGPDTNMMLMAYYQPHSC